MHTSVDTKKDESYSPEVVHFLQCVRNRDHLGTVAALEQLRTVGHPVGEKEYNALLLVCQKQEHLDTALEAVQWLRDNKLELKATAYQSLVRCYLNAGRRAEAGQVIEDMVNEVRSGRFQSRYLVKGPSDEGDLASLCAVARKFLSDGVPVTTEHVVHCLAILKHAPLRIAFQHDQNKIGNFHALLRDISDHLLGLPYADMAAVARRVNGQTVSECDEQGILAESVSDIAGKILKSTVYSDGKAEALVATYRNSSSFVQDYTNTIPEMSSSMTKQNYTVLYHTGTRRLLQPGLSTQRQLPARLVAISSQSCRCPNCDVSLSPLALPQKAKEEVRAALLGTVGREHRVLQVSHTNSMLGAGFHL